MTISEIIEHCDILCPNAFSSGTKTEWLNDIEGRVQTEVLRLPEADVITYEYTTDGNTVPIVLPPYDVIYRSYLCSMIDFANGEYKKYANTLQMFNEQLASLTRFIAKKYRPADRPFPLPKVFYAVQNTDVLLEFTAIPTADIASCYVYIMQGGEQQLRVTGTLTSGGTITAKLTHSQTADLDAGWALAVLEITDNAGNRYESSPAARLKIIESEVS